MNENSQNLDNTLYNIYGDYQKLQKKQKNIQRFLTILGCLSLGIIINIVFVGGLMWFLEKNIDEFTDTNVQNYETLLKDMRNNSDVHSILTIFPTNIDKTKVNNFLYKKSDGPFDGSYLFYLEVNYNKEEYEQEEIRLKNISISHETSKILKKNSFDTDIIEKKPLYAINGFVFPTYVTIFDGYGTSEYASLDENNYRVVYVFDQLLEIKNTDLPSKYILNNYKVPKSLRDTKLGYSIYQLCDTTENCTDVYSDN